MEFGLLDDKDGAEHSGTGAVGIYEIFVMQDAFIFGMESFNRIYIIDILQAHPLSVPLHSSPITAPHLQLASTNWVSPV